MHFDLYLTYDDVLLLPQFSQWGPDDVELQSHFSKRIPLNIPFVSAAMDSVTESKMAIMMALEGGLGVLHRNLSLDEVSNEVLKVKRYVSGIIIDPIAAFEEEPLENIKALMEKHNISGVPIINKDKILTGIITKRDIRFEKSLQKKAYEVMTKNLVTASDGTSLEDAKTILHQHRIEKLPLIDKQGRITGLVTLKDLRQQRDFPLANKDRFGRLRVSAAIGFQKNEFERAKTLVQHGVDVLVIDTSHGHSKATLEMIETLKKELPSADIVAGNVATAEGVSDLIKSGADGVKIGIGPGSICTTRIVTGIGVPQLSAILKAAPIAHEAGVPLIADGGARFSGDIVKALAAGASCCMMGSPFAGTDETPGERIVHQGQSYKVYRGMGSLGAMVSHSGAKDRYCQGHVADTSKLVPEGIEGLVPYRGPLTQTLHQFKGGLRSGMSHIGAKNIKELWQKATFIQVSAASLKENHPHSVMITKEAPNYSQT